MARGSRRGTRGPGRTPRRPPASPLSRSPDRRLRAPQIEWTLRPVRRPPVLRNRVSLVRPALAYAALSRDLRVHRPTRRIAFLMAARPRARALVDELGPPLMAPDVRRARLDQPRLAVCVRRRVRREVVFALGVGGGRVRRGRRQVEHVRC